MLGTSTERGHIKDLLSRFPTDPMRAVRKVEWSPSPLWTGYTMTTAGPRDPQNSQAIVQIARTLFLF
jgi:hypothetical protein